MFYFEGICNTGCLLSHFWYIISAEVHNDGFHNLWDLILHRDGLKNDLSSVRLKEVFEIESSFENFDMIPPFF